MNGNGKTRVSNNHGDAAKFVCRKVTSDIKFKDECSLEKCNCCGYYDDELVCKYCEDGFYSPPGGGECQGKISVVKFI